MADWTSLPNLAVGVGGLPSGTTVTALRDNPIAIAEGAAGAPRVQGVALDKVFLGALFSTNLNTTPVGFIDLGGILGISLVGVVQGTTVGSLDIQYSTDNGATFGSSQTLYSPSTPIIGGGHLDFTTGEFRFTGSSETGSLQSTSRATTVPAGINALRFTSESSGPNLSVSCFAVGSAA